MDLRRGPKMTGFIPAVIPAKAGIQNAGTHRIIRISPSWISGSSPKMTKGEKLRRGPKITILTNGVPRQQKIMCVGVEAENDEAQEWTSTQQGRSKKTDDDHLEQGQE